MPMLRTFYSLSEGGFVLSIVDKLIRYRRVILLVVVMAIVTGLSTIVTIAVLYNAAFANSRAALVEMVNVKASLINAVGRFDAKFSDQDHPQGAYAATLSQVKEANLKQEGFGETGEFVLGELDTSRVVFHIPSRHLDNQIAPPLALTDMSASPVSMALEGNSGVMEGVDYRGVNVLAAFTPLEQDGFALVAKMDLSEIEAPFYRAVVVSFVVAMMLITLAVFIFHKLTSPLVFKLESLVKARTQELDEANKELLYLSQHDSLTGIANRSCFMSQLRKMRSEEQSIALLFIDLDEFKPVNDHFGHPTGDVVLTQIAQRIRASIRSEDLVARIGGDEFAVILSQIEQKQDAVKVAEDVIRAVEAEVEITQECKVKVGCSVGIALDDRSQDSDATLITRADTAMYYAKRHPSAAYKVE